MYSSIEASPLRLQRAMPDERFAASIKAADASVRQLPIHEFGAIMTVGATISEMKNPCSPPQPPLNQRRP
jgi:hypothetical protein